MPLSGEILQSIRKQGPIPLRRQTGGTGVEPPDPGVLSAYGMLVSPVRKDVSRTVLLGPDDAHRIADVYTALDGEARRAMEAEGVPPDDVATHRLADVRYHGQSFELRVPVDPGAEDSNWVEAFHTAHETRYGFARRDARVELVTARVEAVGPATGAPSSRATRGGSGVRGGASADRPITVRYQGEAVEARAVGRARLKDGDVVEGPAVLHEYSATLWLPPGWQGAVVGSGAMVCSPDPNRSRK